MVVRTDIEEGFDGAIEYPPVDAAFREQCVAAVQSAASEAIHEIKEFRGELTLVVGKSEIRRICQKLRDDPDLQFNYLSDITAVDYLNLGRKPRFDVVYHLFSIPKAHRLRLRAPVGEEDCRIDSVVPVWGAADWNERETYDFFGIEFTGHPDLRRILMPDDWEGWPLRKDFPIGGTKSFYFKKSTEPFAGETEGMVPRIRETGKSDV